MHRITRQLLADHLRRFERGAMDAAALQAWAAEVLSGKPVFDDEIDRESLAQAVLTRLAEAPLPSSADVPALIEIVESLKCQHYMAMERLERWLRDAAAR